MTAIKTRAARLIARVVMMGPAGIAPRLAVVACVVADLPRQAREWRGR